MSRNREQDEELFADHVSHPRGNSCLEHPDATARYCRRVCGDEVIVSVRIGPSRGEGGGPVCEVGAIATGCPVCRASASLMCECMSGKAVEECQRIVRLFRRLMGVGTITSMGEGQEVGISRTEVVPLTEVDRKLLGDARILEGLRDFPSRIPCVMLAWHAFDECLTKANGSSQGVG